MIIMVKFKVDDANYNKIYPIGSIYMSINETNPSELFGGEWEQIEDTFLLACGTKYQNGSTGGSEDSVVVKHNHTQNPHSHMPQSNRAFVTQINTYTSNIAEHTVQSGSSYRVATINSNDNWYGSEYTGNITATNKENGVDGTGKNMPPYLAVYVWVRTG